MTGDDFRSKLKCPRLEDLLIQKQALGDKDFRYLQNVQIIINEVINFVRLSLGNSTEENSIIQVIVPIDRRKTSDIERSRAMKFIRSCGFKIRAVPIKSVPLIVRDSVKDWEVCKFYKVQLSIHS